LLDGALVRLLEPIVALMMIVALADAVMIVAPRALAGAVMIVVTRAHSTPGTRT
jgi:hypothetical protein